MTYSAFGLLAVLIHLIVNYDVLRKKVGSTFPAARYYRHFLYTVILASIPPPQHRGKSKISERGGIEASKSKISKNLA